MRKTSVWVTLALAGIPLRGANAQAVCWDEHTVDVTAVVDARGFEPADLDGDGDEDLVVAVPASDYVGWLENLGGVFSEPHDLVIADDARDARAFDLDGDGDLDVLYAAAGTSTVGWVENLGAGAFAAATPITTTALGAASVWAADLDGDGDLDVLSASEDDDTVAWYPQTAPGLWGAASVVSATVAGAKIVRAADLDADGDADLLAGAAVGGEVAWFRNLGGTFGAATTLATGFFDVRQIHTGDLDLDGDLDVVTTSATDNAVDEETLKIVNLGGTFAAPTTMTKLAEVTSTRLVDLDLDGDLDVLGVTTLSPEEVVVLPNQGAGTFGTLQSLIGTTSTTGWAVAPIDHDGDGDLDVFYQAESGVWVAENVGGTYVDADGLPDASGLFTAPLAVRDLDGDGALDLITSNALGLAWYPGYGDGTFAAPVAIDPACTGATAIVAEDLDGDGDLDIAANGRPVEEPHVYQNLGAGSFAAGVPFDDGVLTNHGITALDLGPDNDLDLIVSSDDHDDLAVIENLGGMTFGAPKVAKNVPEVFALEAHDMDGDGDDDLLATLYSKGAVAWFPNLGANLGPHVVVTTKPLLAAHATATDLDLDGDLDVVTAGLHSEIDPDHVLAGYRNNAGVFAGPGPITGFLYDDALAVHAFDATGDGLPDVVGAVGHDLFGTGGDPFAVLYANTGAGFVQVQELERGEVRHLGSGDLDGDGDLDLVTTYHEGVRWYENCQFAATGDTGGAAVAPPPPQGAHQARWHGTQARGCATAPASLAGAWMLLAVGVVARRRANRAR